MPGMNKETSWENLCLNGYGLKIKDSHQKRKAQFMSHKLAEAEEKNTEKHYPPIRRQEKREEIKIKQKRETQCQK